MQNLIKRSKKLVVLLGTLAFGIAVTAQAAPPSKVRIFGVSAVECYFMSDDQNVRIWDGNTCYMTVDLGDCDIVFEPYTSYCECEVAGIDSFSGNCVDSLYFILI